MKRLLTALTLCAAALIGADAATSPAAADGRRDTRRHGGGHEPRLTWTAC